MYHKELPRKAVFSGKKDPSLESTVQLGDMTVIGDMTVMPRCDANVTQGSDSVVEGSGAVTGAPMTVQGAHGTRAVQKEKSKSESVIFKRPYQNLSPDFANRTEMTSLYQADNYKKRDQQIKETSRQYSCSFVIFCQPMAKGGSECSPRSTVGHMIK